MSGLDPRSRTTPLAQTLVGLYRLSQGLQHRLRERAQAHGLSPAQAQALLFLKYARPGVRTIGGLAQRLGCAPATASEVADALERKGLIRRQPLPADQRVITLALTPAGEHKVNALEDLLDDLEAALATLPHTQQEALLQATQALVRVLQQAGQVVMYEMCWGCQFFRPNAHPNNPTAPHHCAFVDTPLPEPHTYLECPDFVPHSP